MLFENPDQYMDESNVLFLPDVAPITEDEYEALKDEFKELAA